ncbi:putative terpene synthase 9 [Quercus suber]|uniref:Terpene synthase 9 n=1 Tax=Quercus suber TaxID=58331 RepID=A0AAW0KI17_QUESU
MSGSGTIICNLSYCYRSCPVCTVAEFNILSSKIKSIPAKAESKRRDVAKSIQCYMVHEGISEIEAKHRIKEFISYS